MPSFRTNIRTTLLLSISLVALFALPALTSAAVIFTEDYESPNWLDNWTQPHWAREGTVERVTNNSKVFNGNASLRVRMGPANVGDAQNVALRHMFSTKTHERLFMRWYEMVEDGPVFTNDYDLGLKGNGLYGWAIGKEWPQNFDESNPKYTLRISRGRPSGLAYMYGYTGGGNEDIEQNRTPGGFTFKPNEWNCYEIELDGNTIGRNDGNIRFWANDTLVHQETNVFLRGQDQMRIQAIENLFKIDYRQKKNPNAPPPTVVFWQDDIAVSTERIGCGNVPTFTPGPCSLYPGGSANFSPYGLHWNWTSAQKALMLQATCETDTTTLNIGNGRETGSGATLAGLTYVYHQGYYNNGTGSWQPYSLQCSGQDKTKIANAWCKGSATASVPQSARWFVAYTCIWSGSKWQCGCSDASCATMA